MNTLFTKIITVAALTGLCFSTEEINDNIETGRSDSTTTQFSVSSTSTEDLNIARNQYVLPFFFAVHETPPIEDNTNLCQKITQFTLKHSGKIMGTVISSVIAYEICNFLATL